MAVIRVLLVEGNRLLRDGATAILNTQPDIKAVSSGATEGDIRKKVKSLRPHVVLLDISLTREDSLRLMRMTRRWMTRVEIIVMGLTPGSSYMMEFLKEGASGFIPTDASLDQFLSTIRAVANGEKVLPAPSSKALLSRAVEPAIAAGNPERVTETTRMTQREQQILDLIATGYSNKEIATTLSLSIHTVKSHIHHILDKLNLHTRLELAHFKYASDKIELEN